jgi:predicted RNA methylase
MNFIQNEALTVTEKQRKLGQYMTPDFIADQMVQMFKRPLEQLYVIDPACGDGNLLAAVARAMKREGISEIHKRLIGVDIDPIMIELTREKLLKVIGEEANQVMLINDDFLSIGYSLFGSALPEGINAVISNPPYGSLREYKFFEKCDTILGPNVEKVFLVPLAFIDRVSGIEITILDGRPLGVTTGHAIIYHRSGSPYKIKSTKGLQSNNRNFEVLSGIKLYEKGAGTPPQTEEIIKKKPYSSEKPIENWLPCLRTGDIQPYKIKTGRLFVNYGEHLAHPKSIDRFIGPKLFVRRMPMWENRTLGAAYSEETILCAGDVLVVKHIHDDVELLKGLEVYLNSSEAANAIYMNRPTVLHRTSYPKISAKDLNSLFNSHLPSDEKLRQLAKQSTEHQQK